MKNMLITLATLVFATAAHAMPLVGDYANFDIVITNGTDNMTGSYEIALTGQNSAGFQMSTTVKLGNQPAQKDQQTVAATDLMDDATVASVLANCAAYGGALQQLAVAAGTFNTCAVPTQNDAGQTNGTVWIGQVPFAVVKQAQKRDDGLDMILSLKSYQNGK